MSENAYGDYEVAVNAYDSQDPVVTHFSYGSLNSLSSLKINSGTLVPAFSPDITEYTVTLDNNKTRIRFVPAVSGKVYGIDINGEAVENGELTKSFILDQKENKFTVNVTSLARQTRTYTINVIREAAGIPSLTAKASIDTNKNVEINGTISTGSGKPITVMVKDPSNRIEYIGTTVSQAGGYYSFNFVLSDNKEGKYTVEAGTSNLEEKTETYFYYLKNIFLKSLTLSNITLSPDFLPNVYDYTAETDGSFDSITVTPVAYEGAERITVNRQAVESGESAGPIKLYNGKNTIKITVEAMGGRLKKTYTITVQKAVKLPELSVNAAIDRVKRVTISGDIGFRSKRTVSVMVTDPDENIEYANSVKTAGAQGNTA